jgi:uncharacterized membrane protein
VLTESAIRALKGDPKEDVKSNSGLVNAAVSFDVVFGLFIVCVDLGFIYYDQRHLVGVTAMQDLSPSM